MTTTYQAKWGSDTVEIRADFAQASCPVEGTRGRQVADFRHRPADAMRSALEDCARAEGMDLEDEETAGLIDAAVEGMEAVGGPDDAL